MTPLPPLKQLDSWLAERETRAGLRPEAAAGIVWAQPRTKTPVSLVYLHGYTATKGEIRPVPDRVAEALGANLFFARLSGHGGDPGAHRTVTVDDWIRDGTEALAIGESLGDQVVVMATSTGATLLTWLMLGPAALRPAAAVLVSPNYTVKDWRFELLLWPGREILLRAMAGEYRRDEPVNEAHGRIWDMKSHTHSVLPMMELVKRTRRLDFRRWPIPALAIYDPHDTTVNEDKTEKLLSKAPVGLVRLEHWNTAVGESNHVIAGDALAPHGTDRMVKLTIGYLKTVLSI